MVVISEEKDYRDEAQRLMRKKRVLKDTGFRVMALATRIHRDAGESKFISSADPALEPLAGSLVVSNSTFATIGGQIMVNGMDLAVTVAHIFRHPQENDPAKSLQLEFDDDGFSDGSEDTENESSESEAEDIVLQLGNLAKSM